MQKNASPIKTRGESSLNNAFSEAEIKDMQKLKRKLKKDIDKNEIQLNEYSSKIEELEKRISETDFNNYKKIADLNISLDELKNAQEEIELSLLEDMESLEQTEITLEEIGRN